jgi:predicted AlkP superfamily pyrophosphatase or phosphodiesterase
MKKLVCGAAASLLAVKALAAPSRNGGIYKKPKLVLTIVVDQFRYDYTTRFQADYNAGLAKLLSKGAVFTNAHYEHFPTVTAVGHSTILSGATPSLSGIVGNEWYDYATKKQVTSVSDESAKLLGGTPGKRASSPNQLLVSSIGDELKLAQKGTAKVIGISIKDRAAILPAGRMADGAYWFDDISGNFVSSTWYFKDLPGWTGEFNKSRAADQFLGQVWTPIGNPAGKPFNTMPAVANSKYFKLMERTPYGSQLLELFAEKAIEAEQLGRHDMTDLLSVSFSSNDYLGHAVGPHDPQVRDMSIRTDRIIGRLLQFVDARIGLDNVLVVFTADHGVSPLPEFMEKNKMPGGRMSDQAVLDAVRTALTAKYGPGEWVVGKSGPSPYLNRDLIREKKLNAAEVQDTAAQAVRELPHISRVYTREQLRQGAFPDDRIGHRIRNGFNGQRGTDLFIVADPYWLFEKTGTSHGLPYNYDSHVPVIFMGKGIQPGRYDRAIAVNDIAPTLATMLEIETPSGAEGRVLEEMFTLK